VVTLLRGQILTVVALLFALSAGVALGGGPLSYVSSDPSDDTGVAETAPDPDDEPSPAAEETTSAGSAAFADEFATVAASSLYDEALLGHPTVIVAMPGVTDDHVDAMSAQVSAAGGGLTGVFRVGAPAVDRDDVALVDRLGSQLATRLDDPRVDPEASTYVRLGQLLGLAFATNDDEGRRADSAATTVRAALGTAGLLAGPQRARLAPMVMVLLPPHEEREPQDALAQGAIQVGLSLGMRTRAGGMVLLGDSASGREGLLTELRRDELVSATMSTVDGGETVLGQVTAMLALIASLDGTVGSYGASGSDGAPPIS
jgi:hypothetical protein